MQKFLKKFWGITVCLFLLPIIAGAVSVAEPVIKDYVADNFITELFTKILTPLYQIAAGLCVVMLIIAGILFITANGDPSKINKAKDAVIWAVLGLVVSVLAFSIVSIIRGLFPS